MLGGTGTDKEKAQSIYDAMTAYKIDAQNVADAIGYSVADVNAYLAKR